MSKKKTFWPYGILLSLFAIVIACIATIIFASNYPVYEDDFYLDKYQNVEKNFDEIEAKQAQFKRLFNVRLDLEKKEDKRKIPYYEINESQKELSFFVYEIEEHVSAHNLKADLLLTRPHTNKQDLFLEASNLELANETFLDKKGDLSTGLRKSYNRYLFKITLPQLEKGRWQVKLKLSSPNSPSSKGKEAIGFYTFNLLVL